MNRPSLPGKCKFHNLGGKLRISCCPDGVSRVAEALLLREMPTVDLRLTLRPSFLLPLPLRMACLVVVRVRGQERPRHMVGRVVPYFMGCASVQCQPIGA